MPYVRSFINTAIVRIAVYCWYSLRKSSLYNSESNTFDNKETDMWAQ